MYIQFFLSSFSNYIFDIFSTVVSCHVIQSNIGDSVRSTDLLVIDDVILTGRTVNKKKKMFIGSKK